MSGNEELGRPADELAAEHAELAFDDAAYLLGGLDQAGQDRFERHLLSCPDCQDSVADLSELPRLLGSVTGNDLAGPLPEPPPSLLPGLLSTVAAARRRRSRWNAAAGFAAACVLLLLVGIGVRTWSDSHSPKPLAMSAVGPNTGGVYATVRLTGSSSAPRIELDCGYRTGTGGYPSQNEPSYRMVVYNKSGQARDLGSWMPQAGEDVRLWRDSPWPRQNLTRIEIADEQGTVLLKLSL